MNYLMSGSADDWILETYGIVSFIAELGTNSTSSHGFYLDDREAALSVQVENMHWPWYVMKKLGVHIGV